MRKSLGLAAAGVLVVGTLGLQPTSASSAPVGGTGARTDESTVALRALGQLSPTDQAEVLRYMAELKARRTSD